MKKKFMRRIATIAAASAIAVGAVCMFAGCSSDHPEVTVTYSFNGEDYEVTYELSRLDAPETTQHFIELADSGFYDGTVIHSYDANFLYGGGYVINEAGDLEEKDYFGFVKEEYEKDHDAFTQTVFKTDEKTPLYTVVGEFRNNNRGPEKRTDYSHTQGALVMYYPTVPASFNYDVFMSRADGGDGNNGEPNDIKKYQYNSATSQFYTFLSSDSRLDLDASYAVFGMVKDFEGEMRPLLDAIAEYSNALPDGESFTVPIEDLHTLLFEHTQGDDPDFEALRRSGAQASGFTVPLDSPILVRSVTVDKY